jgi:hypothetical protein
MNRKLLVLSFLIMFLAVTPAYAQTVYRVHTDKAINLSGYRYYRFGSGIYIYSQWTGIRVTAFFENVTVPSFSWFNYTADSTSKQYIYNSLLTASNVYMNGAEYAEDYSGMSDMYWSQNLGVVIIDIRPYASFPANVSIAYVIPPPPEYESVAITINTFDYNTSLPITAGSVMVDDLIGNQTTIALPAMFSLIKGKTYELTFYGDSDWNYTIGRNINEAANITNPYRHEFEENTALSIYYTAIIPGELLPVPIIFIFGMVGLGCMFVGPIYAINKIKQKEYRNGLVWGVIFTALGFSLFIAWLFGGSF